MNPKQFHLPSERRKAQRAPIALTVWCRSRGSQQNIKGLSKDISGLGISLFTHQPLERGASVGIMIVTGHRFRTGDKIELLFQPSKKNPAAIPVKGRVVWSKKIRAGRYQAGLRFEKIADPIEFIEFICDKLIDVSFNQKQLF